MDIYFILGIKIQCCLSILLLRLFSLALGPVALWHTQSLCHFFFFSTSLISGTVRCSRLILYIFWPSLRISNFSKQPWFLLLENSTRNQDLGSRCAHCNLDVSYPLIPSISIVNQEFFNVRLQAPFTFFTSEDNLNDSNAQAEKVEKNRWSVLDWLTFGNIVG